MTPGHGDRRRPAIPPASPALPTSTSAYVSGGDTLTPIDLRTHRAGRPIAVGTPAEAVALAPGGTTAWVSGLDGDTDPRGPAHADRDGPVSRVGGQPSAVVIAGRARHG